MRILITCFKPFKGRAKNGSQTLARYLKAKYLHSNHQNDEVRVVELAVRWGAVESVTSTIIKNWQPEMILGLGEGGDSSIAFETIGRNSRKGEDVDGNPPPAENILENGESERRCRFSFAWTGNIILPTPLEISLDAGAYLCNNALYFISGTECERVGFIHVPPQGEADDESYREMYGPLLLEILHQNINGIDV